ncbi:MULTISPECIES: bactofilin family protein [unclassified Corallococcus]|uniref:bactofilin family protein n=1 Tax=unclassified Corallococcus TaxID=2685029 RepID=UPI001A8F9F19|nr:polymer-forming cytoskeletal protein [Corallococcus sp. NCRR]MBN9684511.1 polymer-forming cytoskeletal protein [Corallococcus sp. NCSPR001]WAS84015.1 polymer-forming cytoskeletal protein [Corallococcus sp. NCRR]
MATAKDLAGNTVDNTVVGPSILISGRLTGDEDLTVRGRVEGELTLSRTLIVEPSGVVKANVAVKNAIVSGVVVGNINATESVELTREGRMVGDIRAPRVIIVDGASFRGRVDMGDVEPGRLPSERPAVARPQAVTRPTVRPGATPPRPPTPPAAPPRAAPTPPPPPARTQPATTAPATVVARPSAKPLPPPPPPAATTTRAPEPPRPAATEQASSAGAPVPRVMGAGAKKKVVVKKSR